MLDSTFVEGYFRQVEQNDNIQRVALLEEQNTKVLKFIGNYLEFPLRFTQIDQSNDSNQATANRNVIIDQLTFFSTNPSLEQYLPFFVQFNNIKFPSGDMTKNSITNYQLNKENTPSRFKLLNVEFENLTESSILAPNPLININKEFVISTTTIYHYVGNQVTQEEGTYVFFRDDDKYYKKNVATSLITEAGVDPTLWLWPPSDTIITIDGFPLGDRTGRGVFGVYLNTTQNEFFVTALNFDLTLPLPVPNLFTDLLFQIDPINRNIKGNILNGNLVLIYDDNTNDVSVLEVNSNNSVINRYTGVNPALVTTNDVLISLTGSLHYLWDFSNLELYYLESGGTIQSYSLSSGRSTRVCSFGIVIPVSSYQVPLNIFEFFTMDEFGDLYLGSADFVNLTLSLELYRSFNEDLKYSQRYRNQLIHLLRNELMVIVNLESKEIVQFNLPLNLLTLPRDYESFYLSDKYWFSGLDNDAGKYFFNYSTNSRINVINEVYQYTFHFDSLHFPMDAYNQLLFDLDVGQRQVNKKYEIFRIVLDYRIRYDKAKLRINESVPQKDQEIPVESLEDALQCQEDCNETELNCAKDCEEKKCEEGVCPVPGTEKEKCRMRCGKSNCFKKCGRAETSVARVLGYVPPDFAVSDLLKLYTS